MTNYGHNESAVRLAALAGDRIASGNADAADGWISFGEAMGGAAILCGTKVKFNHWFGEQQFEKSGQRVTVAERDAAMWGAANPVAFREGFRSGHGATPQAAMKWALRAARPDQRGFVYVMTNASMPGLVKVGMTKVSPQVRASQISQNTGIPTPFEVVAEFRTSQAERVEAVAHEAMKSARVSASREFFSVTPEAACDAIKAAMQEDV